MIFITAIDAQKFFLRWPIVFRYMAAARASATGVVGRYCQQHATVPRYLVVELPPELAPSLIENGAVQAALLAYLLAVLFALAFGRLGHVPYLQILNAYERVVLADRRCGFVQEVFSGISDAGVNLLDFRFPLFPVTTEFHLAAHAALVTSKALLMLLEAVERREESRVAHGGEPGNADIDADCGGRRGKWVFHFALCLDRRKPLAARLTHGDVTYLTQNVAAVAIAQPAELRKKEAIVGLIELDLFRVGVTEAGVLALFLEAREIGAFGEKVFVRLLQVLQGLLQGVTGRILEPRRGRTIAPRRQELRHRDVADEAVPGFVVLFLHRQRLVIDEPARPGEAAHIARLIAIWHQFVFKGL